MSPEDDQGSGKAAGGFARAKALSSETKSDIARKAARARWGDGIPTATHEGVLKIGNSSIPCYVLENGERVLSTRGIMKALGRSWRGRKYTGTELPVFIEANNLKPFINNELSAVLAPRQIRTNRGTSSEAFRAEILPAVCDIYLRARQDGALTKVQMGVAQQCEILVRALSSVGIIALVDEATGYQEVRPRLRADTSLLGRMAQVVHDQQCNCNHPPGHVCLRCSLLAEFDARPSGNSQEGWLPPIDSVDEVAFREAVLAYGYRCVFAARDRTHEQLQWQSNAFERVILELRKAMLAAAPTAAPAEAFYPHVTDCQKCGATVKVWLEDRLPATPSPQREEGESIPLQTKGAVDADVAFARALVRTVEDYRNSPNRHIADHLLRRAKDAVQPAHDKGEGR